MLDETIFMNLVGRYEKQRDDLHYRDEDDDLHIISVDYQEMSAFIDFNANPEWLLLELNEKGQIILDKKFIIDPEAMSYKVLE